MFLVTTELEVLAALKRELGLGLARDALKTENNLLGSLGFLVENGLGLTTVTTLFAVITTLTLSEKGSLAGLVLGDFVLSMLAAILALAVGLTGLGNVNHCLGSCRSEWKTT